MSDYQAIYDAVRSRISGCDVGTVVADAARQAFDVSHHIAILTQEFSIAAYERAQAGREQQRPFMQLRPKMYQDGDKWCALYGENLQDGVCGFGETPELAARAFDIAWLNEKAKENNHG
jgi:hypothetical protein